MTWIGLAEPGTTLFDPTGLNDDQNVKGDPNPDKMLTRGSFVIETRLTPGQRPQPLIQFNQGGDWPLHLALVSLPDGGISLVLDQGGSITHSVVNHPQSERLDILRITYSWDSPKRWGRLSLEHSGRDDVFITPIQSPRPFRMADIHAILRRSDNLYVSPDVLYMAVSTDIEPIGPMPSLDLNTPIATPNGYVKAGSLQRGDVVLTSSGQSVPVLCNLVRTVPARGHFQPVRLNAPYFGLKTDIVVAPYQQLVISGSVVDYMFGTEAVLVNACHLLGGTSATPVDVGPTITYCQLLLPGHETLLAAGTTIESLYIGRLRRKKERLAASLLAEMDRLHLPDHGQSAFPVLRPFDALVLAEQRAA